MGPETDTTRMIMGPVSQTGSDIIQRLPPPWTDKPVEDLGFPQVGGANSSVGAPTYDFAKISQKLHEIERIWTPGGCASLAPLRSATANTFENITLPQISFAGGKKRDKIFAHNITSNYRQIFQLKNELYSIGHC